MQKDFLDFHEEYKRLYCIYLNLRLTKKSERKRKAVISLKDHYLGISYHAKKKKKKAWTFLTTCEFKADEMPPAVPL